MFVWMYAHMYEYIQHLAFNGKCPNNGAYHLWSLLLKFIIIDNKRIVADILFVNYYYLKPEELSE